MDRMKKNINKAQQQEADRYKKIEESADGKIEAYNLRGGSPGWTKELLFLIEE